MLQSLEMKGFHLAPMQVRRTAYIHVERNMVSVSWNHTDRSAGTVWGILWRKIFTHFWSQLNKFL